MALTRESLSRSVHRTQTELRAALKSGEASYPTIELLLASYRSASQDLIFHDIALASSDDVEVKLWTIHGEVNNVFRSRFKRFRTEEGKRKVVERRKLEKHYEHFIKSSQSFYRGFIQHLASYFANVEEVLEAVRKLKSDALGVDEPIAANAAQQEIVLQSCHLSLVRLGDLSRYRETLLKVTNRNWGPAQGYYGLAITVLPTSGWPYNQLAVIARTDEDALRTIYYLYRALMVQRPFSNAQENLEKDFERRRKLWATPENHNVQNGVFAHFQSRFVAFQAKCYHGAHFDEHRDLQTELLHEITVNLLQNSNGSLLDKICLINISAEAAAHERLSHNEDQGSLHAFLLLQSFNVKLFTQLLKIVTMESQKVKKLVASSEMGENEILTPRVRCLLPLLRQYSSWLMVEVPLLASLSTQAEGPRASVFQAELAGTVQVLWSGYVDALAALASTYPLKGGDTLMYLLAEDEDTLAFKPFAGDSLAYKSRYLDGTGKIKARSTDANVQKQDPKDEMMHRVRGIVKDGMAIAKSMDSERIVPVRLKQGRFVYLPPEALSIQPGTDSYLRPLQRLPDFPEVSRRLPLAQGYPDTSLSMDTEMRDMVDDLLAEGGLRQPEPTNPQLDNAEEGEGSNKNATFTAADLVRQIQHSSQKSRSHPGLGLPADLTLGSSPIPSGLSSSAIRPGSAHASQSIQTPSGPLHTSSGHSFTNLILRQQQEIQARSSPQQSLPQPSSWINKHDTSNNVTPMLKQRSPPWLSPGTPLQTGGEEVPKPIPQRNLFGAIGETPGRTPTSAQPG